MEENMEGKRPKDLTPEERKAFFEGARAGFSDDELKSLIRENIAKKRPKDLTPEERKAFFDDLRSRIGDDGLKAVTEFWKLMDGLISAIGSSVGPSKEQLEAVAQAIASYLKEVAGNRDLASLTTEEMTDIIASLREPQEPFDEDILAKSYLPLLNGPIANSLRGLQSRNFDVNKTGTATATISTGTTIEIRDFQKTRGRLSVSANKLINAATYKLGNNNIYRSGTDSIRTRVRLPLITYGELCGLHVVNSVKDSPEEQAKEDAQVSTNIRNLRKSVLRDLEVLLNTKIDGVEFRGKEQIQLRGNLLSSYVTKIGEYIDMTFTQEFASYLLWSYVQQIHHSVFKIDNRYPNAYFIGLKIDSQSSSDKFRIAGTDSSLSVSTLLKTAPEIPDFATVEGQRASWKNRIKQPLEAALDKNIAVGHISRWEYRHPRTGKTYTSASADALTWEQYERLIVDYVLVDPMGQEERIARRQEEKQQAIAKAEERREKAAVMAASGKKRKRGRPRKTEAQGENTR